MRYKIVNIRASSTEYRTVGSVNHLASREFLVKYHVANKIMLGGSEVLDYGLEDEVLYMQI